MRFIDGFDDNCARDPIFKAFVCCCKMIYDSFQLVIVDAGHETCVDLRYNKCVPFVPMQQVDLEYIIHVEIKALTYGFFVWNSLNYCGRKFKKNLFCFTFFFG